jgi:hypothetical protein
MASSWIRIACGVVAVHFGAAIYLRRRQSMD